ELEQLGKEHQRRAHRGSHRVTQAADEVARLLIKLLLEAGWKDTRPVQRIAPALEGHAQAAGDGRLVAGAAEANPRKPVRLSGEPPPSHTPLGSRPRQRRDSPAWLLIARL